MSGVIRKGNGPEWLDTGQSDVDQRLHKTHEFVQIKELQRLRRVEQAARNMVEWWENSGLIYNCGPVEEIKAALEGGE